MFLFLLCEWDSGISLLFFEWFRLIYYLWNLSVLTVLFIVTPVGLQTQCVVSVGAVVNSSLTWMSRNYCMLTLLEMSAILSHTNQVHFMWKVLLFDGLSSIHKWHNLDVQELTGFGLMHLNISSFLLAPQQNVHIMSVQTRLKSWFLMLILKTSLSQTILIRDLHTNFQKIMITVCQWIKSGMIEEELLATNLFWWTMIILVEQTANFNNIFKERCETEQLAITINEIYWFMAVIILMGHDNPNTIREYWSTNELYTSMLHYAQKLWTVTGLYVYWHFLTLKIMKIWQRERNQIMTCCGSLGGF
jgi:hypothetical protein